MIRMARCCNPVPGDDIIGFITKGRGISVHRKDCDNLKSLPPQERARFIDVSWDTDNTQDKSFNAELTLIAKDQKSMISSISKICEDLDVNISGLNAKANKDETVVINLNRSDFQIKIIIDHDQIFQIDIIIADDFPHRFTTEVHIRLRLYQQSFLTEDKTISGQRLVFQFIDLDIVLFRQLIDG